MSNFVDIEIVEEQRIEVDILSGAVTFLGGVSLGETSSTAYRGDRGKVAYDHSQLTGNPHGLTIEDIPDFDAALQAALANLLQSRIVAGAGISTNYNAGTGILTISAIGTSAGVGTAAIGSTFIVG